MLVRPKIHSEKTVVLGVDAESLFDLFDAFGALLNGYEMLNFKPATDCSLGVQQYTRGM